MLFIYLVKQLIDNSCDVEKQSDAIENDTDSFSDLGNTQELIEPDFMRNDASDQSNILESSLSQIPILPTGKKLRLEILSTWGDKYYVGLNGIDIFDESGRILQYKPNGKSEKPNLKSPVKYSSVSIIGISGNPSDINVLEEYGNDPRHVTNLVGDVNFTRDDLHMWLAPRDEMLYEKEYDVSNQAVTNNHATTYIIDALGTQQPLIASVTIEFSSKLSISMIRLWNYNKSRAHCMRGVKRARLLLDSVVIFDGYLFLRL